MTTIILNGTRVNAINKTPHALNIYDLEGTDVLVTVPSPRMVRVSDITYQVAKPLGRKDLVKAGPAVRDDAGRIIGCRGLAL